MKATKKVLFVLLTLVMVFTLFACSPAASATVAPTTAATSAPAATNASPTIASSTGATAGSRYPASNVKICVETFDPTDSQYQSVQSYLKWLSENIFNVSYIYSEKIDSAEQEMQFVENCGAAGAKGFIAYYNVSKGQVVEKATQLKMYYWGVAEEKEVYDAYKSNPYYLGSVILGNGDYDGMNAVTKAILAQGKTKLVYASGGANFGVAMFINRKAGFDAAVKEATDKGAKITVKEVPGFPDEAWFAAQAAALSGDVDAVLGSFGAEVWVQPVATAGKQGKLAIGSFGGILDFYKQTVNGGLVSAIAAEPSERFGIAVAQIVNAVDGNADALKENGLATNAQQKLWIVTSPDQFNKLWEYEQGSGRMEYSKKLTQLVKKINPNASAATLKELIQAYTIEAITK
jgi:hypothetical protein